MNVYAGLDVSLKATTVCIVDKEGSLPASGGFRPTWRGAASSTTFGDRAAWTLRSCSRCQLSDRSAP